MSREDNEREFARMLYVHENKKMAEVHRITKVPEATLYSWKREEDWAMLRINNNLNPRTIAAGIEQGLLNLYELRASENNGKIIFKGGDGDAIHKLVATRAAILKESNYIGIAFDVLDRFQKLLNTEHPKILTPKLQAIIADFLKNMMDNL